VDDAGNGGNLSVTTDRAELLDGGQLSSTTTGTGNAGSVTLTARQVRIAGVQPGSDGSPPFASGVFAQTRRGGFGAGDAGIVRVTGFERLEVDDRGRISVTSVEDGVAGDIQISGGGVVEISDGAELSATVSNTRAAEFPDEDLTADIRIEDVDALNLSNARITAETTGSGEGGDIVIRARRSVILVDGATITARSLAPSGGEAGTLDIDAGDRFVAIRESLLETRAADASGGQIAIQARELVYFSDSRVDTFVQQGGGDGGDFGIPVLPGADPADAVPPEFVVLNRSRIVASAQDGDGGNIEIAATDGFFPSDRLVFDEDLALARDSVLDATSDTGFPGEIEIVSPAADLVGQVTPLPVNYFDASEMMTTACEARRARTGSFVVQARAAVEAPPDAPLSAPFAADSEAGGGREDSSTGRCPTMQEEIPRW
jgi:hypothetical protein